MTGFFLLGLLLAAPPAPSPTKTWPEATPESQGLDRGVLDVLDHEFASGKHGYVDSMLVIRNGRVVYEKSYKQDYDTLFVGKGAPGIYNYYDPGWHPYYKRTSLHTLQSASKSVTSALIGIAIGRGQIPGVDAKVMPYLSAFKIPEDSRRDRMTLRDVLTMTTGIRWDEESTEYTDSANNCAVMEDKQDWVQYVLEQPMAEDPGKIFVYNSGATMLLSALIRKTTGKEADDYAKENLFAPLGIEYYWKRTPTGVADTEGGLYLAPRDLAKIGYLYLKDGVWDGKRILPEGWVKASTRESTRAKEGFGDAYGYGYQWWVIPRKGAGTHDAYAAWGYGGQLLIVVPELELITVFTGWNIYEKPSLNPGVVLPRVFAAVKK
jgi:CubicO group peptidase (beta-lactamase class C family)